MKFMKTNRLVQIAWLSLFFFSSTHGIAQVVIGTDTVPQHYSILELSTKEVKGGLRLPQLTTAIRDTLSVSSNPSLSRGLMIFNTTDSCINYYTGTHWKSLCEEPAWFYMPSIAIDVSTTTPTGTTYQRDLYLEYRKQFADDQDAVLTNSPTAGTALVGSPGAPMSGSAYLPFTKIYDRSELYYYIIGYDYSVFTVAPGKASDPCPTCGINANGLLTYRVNAGNVTDATYMNIVFVVK